MVGATIDSLGRYSLSGILSFLPETEGTSLLLTKRRFARSILPLFRLPPKLKGLVVKGSQNRHQFIVYSAQDPEVLLERLNARRLSKRKRHGHNNGDGKGCYEINKTTAELAVSEWNDTVRQSCCSSWPAPLELLRFLPPKPSQDWGGLTVLASYPRSGNTLLRNLLERTTGVVTGSDNRPDRTLSRALAEDFNLVGEGVTRRVGIVKTHWPEREGFCVAAQKAILLVRNPYDAIDSYWNLNLTNTHTETVTDEVYAKYHDTFQALALNELKVWMDFHYYWMNVGIPVLIVRFEDLILRTKAEMTRIVSFVTNSKEEQGRRPLCDFWRQRVEHACGSNGRPTTNDLGTYKPRSATLKSQSIGKSLRKGCYSAEFLEKLNARAEALRGEKDTNSSCYGSDMLAHFGYDTVQQGFPHNFDSDMQPPPLGDSRTKVASSGDAVMVNRGQLLVRAYNDPYGRAMKQWRQARTNNDCDPFPVV